MADTDRENLPCCDPCTQVRGGGTLGLFAITDNITGGQPHPVAECCRCIPRAIWFRCTPDDADAYCCYPVSYAVYPSLDNSGGWLKAVYSATLFGYTWELSVGRFSRQLDASGYEDTSSDDFDPYGYCDEYDPYTIGYCAWRLKVLDGTTVLYYEEYPFTNINSCTPPNIQYGPIAWPPQCDDYSSGSYVTFEPFIKGELAYIENHQDVDKYSLRDLCPSDCEDTTPTCLSVQYNHVEVWEYNQIADIDGYSAWSHNEDGNVTTIQWDDYQLLWVMLDSVDSELATGGSNNTCPLGVWQWADGTDFCVSLCDTGGYETEVSFICGSCRQVCETVCVNGNWRGQGWEYLDFGWIKELATGGVYPDTYTTHQQGWRYTDPETGEDETLWLVDTENGCELETDFTNNFPNIVISSGCACDLFEESHDQPWPGDFYWYTVSCGWCTEYSFSCGSCRCVPYRLCLFYFVDGVFGEEELTWDATNKQWGNDSTDTFTVHLEEGAYGDCEAVVYYEGEVLYLYQPVSGAYNAAESYNRIYKTYDCEQELWVAHTDDDFTPVLLPTKEGVRLAYRAKCRQKEADDLHDSQEGMLTPSSDHIYIGYAALQDSGCKITNCDSFFYDGCPNSCIDKPKTLNATVMLRSDDYGSGYGEEWSFDLTLSLEVEYQGEGVFYCGYVGSYAIECAYGTEVWTVSIRESGFSIHIRYYDGPSTVRQFIHTFAQAGGSVDIFCNPIYAETPWEDIFNPVTLAHLPVMCTYGQPEEDQPFTAKLIVYE